MNKYLKLGLILLISILFIVLLYGWYEWDAQNKVEKIVGSQEITSSELILTLLNQEEIEKTLNLKGAILPLLAQFNDKLDIEDANKYGYSDLVARLFISKNSGDTLIETVITSFNSEEKAKNSLMMRAEQLKAKTSYSFEGKVLTLYMTSQGDENNPPSATIRFAINNIVSKIKVYGDNPTIDYTNPELIGALVIKLATEQKAKIEQSLQQGVDPRKLIENNMAFNNLPNKISDAELIGMIPITQQEWLGETRKLEQDKLQGFKSGAQANFKIPKLPGHVISIVILEFENKEDALKEQQTFFNEGAHIEDTSSKKLSLPDSIKTFSLARTTDTMTELQAVNRVYIYDISIFAPYSDLNKQKTEEQLIKVSKEIFG